MFFSLLSGLAIAFALQLLLTNLGVALGLSTVGLLVANADSTSAVGSAALGARDEDGDSGHDDSHDDSGHDDSGHDDEGFSAPVTHLLGLGVTLSVAPVLFLASFLATEFSQFASLWRGAIFGTILWSVYLLIVAWLSSKTVSGITDVVLGGAAAGLGKLFWAVKKISPLGNTANNTAANATEPLSETERIRLIVGELGTALSTQDYLPGLIAQRKEALIQEMGDRAQLSPQQAETIITQLSETFPTENAAATEHLSADKASTTGPNLSESPVPYWRKLMRMGLNQLDVTDWDLESAWNAIQTVKGVQEALPFNIISLDVEDYLSEIPQWVLASDSLETDLIERLYDPEADPELVKRQLKALKPEDFMQWLGQRGDLSDEAIQTMGGKLSEIYHSVLETVEAKAQAALTQSSKAASATRATFSENGGAVKVLKQLGTTAEKMVSQAAEKIDSQIANGSSKSDQTNNQFSDRATENNATDGQTTRGGQSSTDSSQTDSSPTDSSLTDSSLTDLKNAVDQKLKGRLSEVQNKLLSYFRYTTLDKLTAESVGEKLKSQLEASDLLSPSGKMSLGDGPISHAVKSWLAQWWNTSSTELNAVIQKRKGMTKKQYALLKQSLQSAWETYYPLSSNRDDFVEGQSVEDGFDTGQSANDSPDHNNDQKPGFPRRWAKRMAQNVEDSLAHKLATSDWQQQVRAQLVSAGSKGSEAVENAVGGSVSGAVSGAVEAVETAMTDTLEAAQGQFGEAIASAQQKIEAQVESTKHELQVQAEAVRHQAAIAAWWLLISLLTSELAAAGAGWLAVSYPLR